MSFTTIEFLLFLPIVFLLYWFVFKPLRWQNLLVLVASYMFYGWWDWRFLCLIALTSVCSYGSGLLIKHYEGRRSCQKAVSSANIVLNLGILATFKYYNFFVTSLEDLLGVFGLDVDWPTAKIILPVGISFYTFQALSYSIDVYRKKIEPTRNPIAFFAFISFFPQLVAGPIERATNLLPQFLQPRRFDYTRAVDGLRQMLWGFFKKMVIADGCASVVDALWANYAHQGALNLTIGCVLFTFQIYCDFSGYSDIAIGCARLFGFNLMRNFARPFLSVNIPDFWRRWHISLTSWFRDYVYIPLGGNRRSRWRTVMNTLVVFAISGLWHGANWTFVLWGVYHGVLISLFVLTVGRSRYGKSGVDTLGVRQCGAMLVTFALVVIGFFIFRAPSVTLAADYVRHLFTNPLLTTTGLAGTKMLMLCAALMVVEWLQRDVDHPLQFAATTPPTKWVACRWGIYLSLVLACLLTYSGSHDFIYFQF